MRCVLLFAALDVFITLTMQEKSSSKHNFNTFFPKVVLFGDSLTQVRTIQWVSELTAGLKCESKLTFSSGLLLQINVFAMNYQCAHLMFSVMFSVMFSEYWD